MLWLVFTGDNAGAMKEYRKKYQKERLTAIFSIVNIVYAKFHIQIKMIHGLKMHPFWKEKLLQQNATKCNTM